MMQDLALKTLIMTLRNAERMQKIPGLACETIKEFLPFLRAAAIVAPEFQPMIAKFETALQDYKETCDDMAEAFREIIPILEKKIGPASPAIKGNNNSPKN
jgi:hypothetical protein